VYHSSAGGDRSTIAYQAIVPGGAPDGGWSKALEQSPCLEDECVSAVGQDRQCVVRADIDRRRALRVSLGRSVSEVVPSKRVQSWLNLDGVVNADAVGGLIDREFEPTILPSPARIPLEGERQSLIIVQAVLLFESITDPER
jgi:hypothetical protein